MLQRSARAARESVWGRPRAREGVTTESIVTHARSGTVRTVRAVHQLDKLMRFSQIDYTSGGGPQA